MRFAVLASGSTGNCTLIDVGESAFLIDLGIGPRSLEKTLASLRLPIERLKGVVLTHTHSDHWNPRCISFCLKKKIPWWCHPQHEEDLSQKEEFLELQKAGLVHHYGVKEFETEPGWLWKPIPLQHDSPSTHGFLLRLRSGEGAEQKIGYLADLGSWDNETLDEMKSLDLLALEFNHDEDMQRNSGRPHHLISRIMGQRGHLSNQQGRDFLSLLGTIPNGLPRHIVQVHLSEMCNHPEIARRAALEVLEEYKSGAELHTSVGKYPGLVINLAEKSLFTQTIQASI